MRKRIGSVAVLLLGALLLGSPGLSPGRAGDPKDEVKKPVLGDRDDVAFQNLRYLKVKNDTDATLTVFYQYRTLVEGAFKWLPETPKDGAEALSFEIKAGEEIDVKVADAPLGASRMRIWATSENAKFLAYKTRDLWLVPEKNDEGDHVYAAEAPETFLFRFTSEKGDKDDTDLPVASTNPAEDPSMVPPDVLPNPGDEIKGGGFMPVIRDLSVMPVFVSGVNAVVRVKNRGHASQNIGRRLFIKKQTPGALATDLGPIGALFHNTVRVFPIVGLPPGDYVVFVNPGDDVPYDANDARTFTVAAAPITDLRVLPVFVSAGKAKIRVKNVGSVASPDGRKLKLVKLAPGAIPADVGIIGALAVNGVQTFPEVALAPGNYRAYISPGDMPAYAANDSWTFAVAAAVHSDLKVLPVAVIGGNVHVHVKNIGTGPAAAGKNLMVIKLAPGAIAVNKGPIGALGPGGVKSFPAFPLPPGNYKAFLSPGDPAPYSGNDFDNFVVGAAPFVDLTVLNVTVLAGKAHIKVKNVGTAPSAAGRSLKVVKVAPGAIPIDKGDIGALAPGDTRTFLPFPLPPGNYKAFISPGDAAPHAGNDSDLFSVAPAAAPDLAVGVPTKAAGKVKATITNTGPGNYTPGTRQWHLEKWNGMTWIPIPTVGSHNIPAINNGNSITVQGNFTGAGTYRIRITGADGNSGNDVKNKAL